MINARNLITAMIVGAIVAGLVREIGQYGLVITNWSLHAPRLEEYLVLGALVAAISQLIGQGKGRR